MLSNKRYSPPESELIIAEIKTAAHLFLFVSLCFCYLVELENNRGYTSYSRSEKNRESADGLVAETKLGKQLTDGRPAAHAGRV
jgi:hypothetical protein